MVIRLGFGEDLSVGNVNHPACALICIHPVSDLHQSKLKDSYVNHIPRLIPDLDPVPYLKRAPSHDESPACKVDQ